MCNRFLAFLALALMAVPASWAQQPAVAPFQVHPLTANVFWVEGGGGNSGVLIGGHSVIIIDAKMTPEGGKRLLAAVAQLTPKPVTTVILTHSDPDHVNGLAGFPPGLEIIAHENNKKEQEAALAAGDRRAPPADRLPTRLVTRAREDLDLDGVKLELFYWGPAHTSGDLVIYLPEQKIVFTGDLVTVNIYRPLIHAAKHGSSEGWIKAVRAMTELDAERFVPGHGDVQTKQALAARLRDAVAERARIKELVAQGWTLDRIQAAIGDPPPRPGAPAGPSFPPFSEVVYDELTGKTPPQ
jgi:glyoxylase-like metal-dependent hydrolase (beta-lactamase superfamily II)